jgi:hypothetical protein
VNAIARSLPVHDVLWNQERPYGDAWPVRS